MNTSQVFAADLLKLFDRLSSELHEDAAKMAGFHRESLGEVGGVVNVDGSVKSAPLDGNGHENSSLLYGSESVSVDFSQINPQLAVVPQWLRKTDHFDESVFVSAACNASEANAIDPQLVSPERFYSFAGAYLRSCAEGYEPNVPQVVHRLATAQPLHPWPRVLRHKWPSKIQVILDVSQALTPFKNDFLNLLNIIRRLLPQRLNLICTSNGEPGRWIRADHLADQVKVDGSPVVILGDAGCYRQQVGLHDRWVHFAHSLARSGRRPLLLAPLPQRLVPDSVREAFDVVLLDQGAELRFLTRYPPNNGLTDAKRRLFRRGQSLLCAALFGNSHVRWSLVRRMRCILQQSGIDDLEVDIGTEAELWQDARVCVTSTACALAADQVELARALLLRWHAMHPALVAKLARCHLDSLSNASPLVRAVYVSEAANAKLLPSDDLRIQRVEAERVLTQAARCLYQTPNTASKNIQDALRDFMAGLGQRSPGAVGRGSDRLQTAWILARKEDFEQGQVWLPRGVRRDLLEQVLGPKKPARKKRIGNNSVFVSYCRTDDELFGKSTRGWVTTFAENLEKLLRQQPGGRSHSVWIDHALSPEQSLTPGLSKALNEASALLVILSPGYLDSDWCPGELSHFLGRFGGSTDERVFLTEYMPVVRDQLPEAVRGLVPWAFWEKPIDKLAPMTLGFPSPSRDDRLYWNQLRELAHAIGGRLARDLDNVADGVAGQPACKVWIASPTDDLRSQMFDLAGFLRQHDCEVIDTDDATTYTKRGAKAEAELRAALAGANLLLQCFGPLAGRVYGDLNESVTALQYRVAKSIATASGKPFLTWRAPDLALDSIADPAYRAVLANGMACGLEEFKWQVLAALRGADALPVQPRSALQSVFRSGGTPLICVSADTIDQPLAQQVLDLLNDLGAEAMLTPEPSLSQPPQQWRNHYEDVLAESDGLLIVYGRTQLLWVQGRLAASRRMIANRRASTVVGLLDCPPPGKPELGVQLKNLSLLDCRDGIRPEPLQHFLQQVRSGGAAGAGRA